MKDNALAYAQSLDPNLEAGTFEYNMALKGCMTAGISASGTKTPKSPNQWSITGLKPP